MFACVVSALVASPLFLMAASLDNPYANTITNRNLFSLKAPPDPASLVPQVTAPPLPDVKLAGITTLMGNTRAILRVMRAAKPPEPAKEVSLFLSPGGSPEDGVQVLDIDVAQGLVKISNNGTPQTLDITKNAPKSAPAPASPVPAPAGLPIPPPGGVMPAPQASVPALARPLRTGPGVVGGGPDQVGAPPTPSTPEPMSLETQTIGIEMNRIKHKALVDSGQLPPYPPTELTPIIDAENQQQQHGQ